MRGPITSATLPGRTSRAKRLNLEPQKSMSEIRCYANCHLTCFSIHISLLGGVVRV